MAMQMGDREIRAKLPELRMICDKEIEIRQQRSENAALSFHKSLQSIKSIAQETVSNEEKIGKLKAQLRAVEDDLVKAISVKTRNEAKKMAIADSISATKARIEQHKQIVADQRARKDQYAQIISYQSQVLKECEEKHKQDAEYRDEIEEAISWYNKALGFRIERGRGIKFIFTNINPKISNKEYFFTIRLENDIYSLLDCNPPVNEANKLVQELNITNGFYNFVRIMRTKFQTCGNFVEVVSNHQESTIISKSAPLSSVSTDSASGTPAKDDQSNKVVRKSRHFQGVQSSFLSPGSASSLRRSPRFRVMK